jgi:transposase
VFLAISTDGDNHQEMNSVVFLEWFENQLMPALNNPSSLAVLDNASYHNVKTEDTCAQILIREKLFSREFFNIS